MKTQMFSVYDTKALIYGVPFFMQTKGAAIRAFTDLAHDPQSMVARHPKDFILFHVGEFDDSDATTTCVSPVISLGLASDYIEESFDMRSKPELKGIQEVPQIHKPQKESKK